MHVLYAVWPCVCATRPSWHDEIWHYVKPLTRPAPPRRQILILLLGGTVPPFDSLGRGAHAPVPPPLSRQTIELDPPLCLYYTREEGPAKVTFDWILADQSASTTQILGSNLCVGDIKRKCLSFYQPLQNLSVDEFMVKSKAHCHLI